MSACPPLRTILDLDTVEDLDEVDSVDPFLQTLIGFAKMEQALPFAMMPAHKVEQVFNNGLNDPATRLVRVFIGRLVQMAPATLISAHLASVVAVQGRGKAAKAVLWAHAAAAHFARTGEAATVGGIVLGKLDGWLPSDHGFHSLWLAQKLSLPALKDKRAVDVTASDNWLDHKEAWEQEALLSAVEASTPRTG